MADIHKEFGMLIGDTPEMAFVHRQIRAAAASDDNVLVYGDTGTGKELVAREIHRHGVRAHKPFVALNCSAIPRDLCESELFGHIKGAFSGAIRDKKGKFEKAEGGTLFLDEIGTMNPAHQAILLRAIDNRRYERVGCNVEKRVSCRIIAASNRNLMQSMEAGMFRPDLYYRLDECFIHMPRLQDRIQDVPVLARHFVNEYADARNNGPRAISDEAMGMLIRHDWPGNVRELQNTVKKAFRNCTNGTLRVIDFAFRADEMRPEPTAKVPDVVYVDSDEPSSVPVGPEPLKTLEEVECEHIMRVLEAMDGNKVRAAEVLGVQRKTLYNKLRKLGIGVGV